ncbi:phosphoribosylaminoimidazolesuccinocarboxamide synthase [Candidatus Daviesbacteria bacterium RIFCSPHIGHO2_01_FULL_40_11]|uniref:Phosphoribosylaminoimidazole-succinocarboxamide synthase n=1 Tax=Candidatus Daviesbacteria bacterium RIFCSPHIGHO2_01_FULL_40_11 TaxID=1797762 RepID=A0A1F5JHV0_9BACT|nr:MAG: phosphoribosylaminoimidazolesuccinocarboxamide synthase [Candidatus Daviesbacteria bacterium RIFCSPHIGHO2_01_FULL_40_11]OGE62642.1 MAG: phosphoribosylaminoimidazolesuccinocarboxamide synthase [Candidatus Daviesbacteria bacterium RIFCSPLOWO2_01_FULL_40_27]
MIVLKTVNIPGFGKKYQGKVRDSYKVRDKRIIITTDRQSAFDRVLGFIPFKGQVLTKLSEFWFKKTADIIQNHLLSVPDPNVMVVKNCRVIPIEMVVRGYITGVTDTSIWGSYEKGERVIYGIKFPEGLRKNEKLPEPVITPTTKAAAGHDERLTEEDILKRRIVSPSIWKQMKKAVLALYKRGQKICDKTGIILADTKYEFGLDEKGKLILVDEIHTPDSSRYWINKTYQERLKKGLEPDSFDKEVLRIWFKERGFSGKGKIPKMSPEFISKIGSLYMGIYEKITGKKFVPDLSENVNQRIKNNIRDIIYNTEHGNK